MTTLTDDEITAAAIEQAQELPEPTAEQAHDAVARMIMISARSYRNLKNKDGIGCTDALLTIRRLEHATRLLREVERLREWVNDLQNGMYINCVYCGHRYGPSDTHPATLAGGAQASTQDALRQHIEQCPAHPLSFAIKENERLRADLEAACELVRQRGLATGHADNVEQLVAEVLAQVDGLRAERDQLRDVIMRAATDLTPDQNDPDERINHARIRVALRRAVEPPK